MTDIYCQGSYLYGDSQGYCSVTPSESGPNQLEHQSQSVTSVPGLGPVATATSHVSLSAFPGGNDMPLPTDYSTHPESLGHDGNPRFCPGPDPVSSPSHYSDSDHLSDMPACHHIWCQTAPVSSTKQLSHLIVQAPFNSVPTFFCGWHNCTHPVGFRQKAQLITHIRSAHLQERPFQCTCGTLFGRKQEAIRHVNAMTSGKKYKCSFCQRAFVRKQKRDQHEDICTVCDSNLTEDVPIIGQLTATGKRSDSQL
ncbi:hypothetical protein JB92DRAFT_2842115 [Gautieria morchelliformis]|nr:hypothetical protein JB92DRAFT_2842115 [Gautieria morchelliformis]